MTSPVVHIVDDDLDLRRSLAFLVASDGFAVRLYEGAESFLNEFDDAQDGCVLVDVLMPGINGLELITILRRLGSTIPVIVMTGHADVDLAVEAMKRGAVDFIAKPFDLATLLGAIRDALQRSNRHVETDASVQAVRERLASLSKREREVLDRLLAGKANKMIAFDLEISPRTVEIYRANVMSKMGAKSLSALIRLAMSATQEP
ncbi:response regulator FixJ [Hansschlegelia beijingensis]|uniref:Two-component system response regulator FixJ n=1 Tax=Hansschlegelia beijingensis TaxID=1133344 RepID=A0A7W6GE00_9HYPH|nr:response regulator FixJ [Hansschlegelia beijingensis]MBB3971387.1 two-component system response regulator FixJ [Hansschlegelia beijingensis]